ncbi:MAG: class I SAM-dependent methyltransferase [candidate division Zixibacteria bacterium]|nr:class I SAM-dependent methyltransferase [candidate division Zixibacteria bacterium]
METFVTSDQRRMYGDLSWAWPIISPPEDYIEETEEYIRLIKDQSRIPVSKILNLGCGGGQHDNILVKDFEITGVDLSNEMLGLARQLNPNVAYVNGDMRAVRLGQGFDAVTVFDSIAYMRTLESLKAAFLTAYTHLRPGGVFVTCIAETVENFEQNKTTHTTHKKGDIEITLIENHYDPVPNDFWYEANFIYMIRRAGDLTIETDCHLLGLFEFKTWMELMQEVGLEVFKRESLIHTVEGRPLQLLIGVKPVTHT